MQITFERTADKQIQTPSTTIWNEQHTECHANVQSVCVSLVRTVFGDSQLNCVIKCLYLFTYVQSVSLKMFKVFRLALFVATIYLFTPKSVVYCSSLMNRDSLRHIRMCDNQLEMDSLPNQFFAELTRLQAVSINNCRLSSVPGDLFMGSPYIRNISLANNHLSELPANIFDDQPNLMNLDLSYNEITELDDSIFSGTLDLAVLRLSHNRFSDISR